MTNLHSATSPPEQPASTEIYTQPQHWAARLSLVTAGHLDLFVALLLLALAFAFMLPGLPPARVAAPTDQLLIFPPWHSVYPDVNPRITGGDLLLQQLPWRHWVQQELQAGRFPLWASSPLGGTSLFASYQPGVLFPLHLLWVLLPIGAGLGIIMALKLWIVGLGMWFFLRALGLHPIASAFSALGLMFSTWFVGWLTWEHTSVYLVLPWLAWAAYMWQMGGGKRTFLALALLTACAIFGGHPETLFIIGIVLVIWVLALLTISPRRLAGWRFAGLVAAVALGTALGAIQLLPFYEALGLSHQATLRESMQPGLILLHSDPMLTLDWILPRSDGYYPLGVLNKTSTFFTEANGYAGLVAILGLLLAVIAGLRRRLDLRLIMPWLVSGVVGWLVAFDGGLGSIIRSIPGFSQSVSVRWVSIVAFSLLVISAFGWDRLIRWIEERSQLGAVERWPRRWLGGVGCVLLAEGLLLMLAHTLRWIPPPVLATKVGAWWIVNNSFRFYWTIWSVGLALAILGATALWIAPWRWRLACPALLGLLLLTDLWSLNIPLNGTGPAADYFPETGFLQQVISDVPSTERIMFEGDGLPANSALVYHIRDWRASDPLITERGYQASHFLDPTMPQDIDREYIMVMENAKLQIAPMFGMSYFVFPASADADPNNPAKADPDRPKFTRLAYSNGLGLWRAEGVPGFAYLSDNVTTVGDEAAAAKWIRGVTWAQVRAYSALVEAPVSALASVKHDPLGSSPGNVMVEEYTPGHVQLRVNALRPSLLVVAESYYPGWHATIDKSPATLLRANYLSQGVVVPAGVHTVELDYSPDSFRYGALVSGLAAVVLLLLALSSKFLRRAQLPFTSR